MLYPWQQDNWQQITDQWDSKPNAWLLTGKAKTGKTAFAHHLAYVLLCENRQEQYRPCQTCLSCRLFAQGNHPDMKILNPQRADEESAGGRKLAQIKIDAVREAIQFTQLSSHRGGMRVLIVNPAEAMNTQAANALLKVLEEPPANMVFILVSSQKDRLLPTIKSRCRPFSLAMPAQKEALDYLITQNVQNAEALLAFYGGAPLFELVPEQNEFRETLLNILSEPGLIAYLDFAARFDQKKWALSVFLDWMQKWLMDLIWVRYHSQAYFYPEYTECLKKRSESVHLITLFDYLNQLNQLSPYGQHTLNVKLQIESIFIDYLNLIKT